MSTRVAVIGGGLAGITAALRCADAGASVTLLEAKPKLGGLTHSFNRGDLHVDNGQHVFLRCCTNYLALLQRLGVADRVTVQPKLDIPVRLPGKQNRASLTRTSLPAPLHLAGALLGYKALSPMERLKIIRASMALRSLDLAEGSLDTESFGNWLRAHGQSDRSIAALWDLFTVATLNAPASQASLALATKVFQTGLFEQAEAGDIGWSLVPLQALHGDSALAALAKAGAEVRTSTKIDCLAPAGDGWLVTERSGETHQVEQVVLATPAATAEQLMPAGCTALAAGWSSALASAAIVNVHIVFDQHVMDEAFFAGVNSPVQWVFDRSEQSGLVGSGNGRGQYLALSLSAADSFIGSSNAEIRSWIVPALLELLPRARRAGIVDFFVTREREATFRPAPGSARLRPSAQTSATGLALAGAWTATGWPATMEGAVLSGNAAADALLNHTPTNGKGLVAA